MPNWGGAKCAEPGVDPKIFFPEGAGGHVAADTKRAKALCRSCPVRPACLAYALTVPVETAGPQDDTVSSGYWVDGTWGGTTAVERADLRTRGLAAVA